MSMADEPQRVAGERGIASVARALSLQARVSNWLATGLMLLVGCGLLGWYYVHQLGRVGRVRRGQGPVQQSIATEIPLPPLGPIEPPGAAPVPHAGSEHVTTPPAAAGRTPEDILKVAAISDPLDRPAAPALMEVASRPARGARPRDRRLSAPVYVAASLASSGSAVASPGVLQSAADQDSSAPGTTPPGNGPSAAAPLPPAQGPLAAGLSAPMALPVTARSLGRQSLILPKGTSIDCTLETAIDSTLPGLTRCLTATDTFGADGRVVLLERGTELVGETQGQVQQGAARIFVLWSEARTPQGVIVPLASPGADQLGRAGLPGTVQRHFWQRFGAAILVSTIDGAVQAAVQASNRGNGTVIYNPGATQDVMTEVLRSTVAIPPTVRKANGDRIQVLVAHDVDFGDVYELRAAGRVR